MQECSEKLYRPIETQVIGTDLDADAIEEARAGKYPLKIASNVSAGRLALWFVRQECYYRICDDLRGQVVFGVHDVIQDPPFMNLDVLSCRNVLIYFNPEVQKRLLPIFYRALKPGGLLFLGTSESIGEFHDLFETLNEHWKIYRRKEVA